QLPSSNYSEGVFGDFSSIERQTGRTTLQRFVRDHFRRIYVSYSVRVEATSETGVYRVTLSDSSAPIPSDVRSAGWEISSPAPYPIQQMVRDGDEIPVQLPVTDKGVELV